jgi:hypothetical protein
VKLFRALLAIMILPACSLDFTHGLFGDPGTPALDPDTIPPSVCGDGVRTQHETCGSAATIAAGSATDARLVDLTGHGVLDLVYIVPGALIVRRGTGSGTFGPPAETPGPADAGMLAYGDVDNDALADVVAAGAHQLTLWRGDGHGALDGAASAVIEYGIVGEGVGDVDGLPGDEIPLSLDDGNIRVMEYNGSTRLTPRLDGVGAVLSPSDGSGSDVVGPRAPVIVGDYSGGGIGEIACVRSLPDAQTTGIVYLTNGNTQQFGEGDVTGVAVADLDGDDEAELIASEASGSIQTYSATQSGHNIDGLPPITFIATGDIDGDGRADVIAGIGEPQELVVLFGAVNSGGLIVGPSFPLAGQVVALHVDGDANGDGIADPVVTYASGDIAILLSSAP